MRPKLYITRSIPQKAVEILLRDFQLSVWDSQEAVPRGELINGVRGTNAILCMPTDVIDGYVLDSAGPSLRVVASLTESCDHIDVSECRERGVAVTSAPSMTSNQIADMVLTLVVLTMKMLVLGNNQDICGNLNDRVLNAFKIESIKSKTVGILGMSQVGVTIAAKFHSLGLDKLLYTDSSQHIHASSMNMKFVSFLDLLKRSDIICVCCSLTNSTRGIFDRESFELMKTSAILINVSRGEIVNNSDLYHALRDGEIAAAGLSVSDTEPMNFRHPLSGLSNCVIQVPKLECNMNDFRIGLACDVAYKVISHFEQDNRNVFIDTTDI